MALCSYGYNVNNVVFRCALAAVSNKWLKYYIRRYGDKAVSSSIALDTDCINEFTTQLMQRKFQKWEALRAKTMLNSEKCSSEHKVNAMEIQTDLALNARRLDISNLDVLLKDAVKVDNRSYVKEIIGQCARCGKLPTVEVLLEVLHYFSKSGDKETIINIARLCHKVEPKVLKDFSYFKHFMAEAVWIKGNINVALIMFEDVFRNNESLRSTLHSMLRRLMVDAVVSHSEATLLNMINFTKRLVEDFQDFYLLSCIWQACLLSEWFTDQTIALELLEENKNLLDVVSRQIPFVIALLLTKHRVEVVYRLLELLLRLDHTSECKRVLEALFDYRVSQGDLRGCSEIIKWSIKQGLDIQAFKHEAFVNLLISYAGDPTIALGINVHSKQTRNKPGYNLKF